MYFLNNTSTRAISQFLKVTSKSQFHMLLSLVGHINLHLIFKEKASIFNSQLDLNSDDWHADETVVFINGKKYYLWLAIDSETRFVLAFHLTQARDSDVAFILMNQAKSMGKPNNFITDRLPSYNEAVKPY
ncbi:ISCpe7, transposase [Clostridium perfringens]|uniref:ISCpe7, transposase n=1 Tax=Clostridium perfringens TaxID=1502 RepID=A0A2X3HXU5_CLOPF|nr:ISCpe7, transposase [Clostridium perfringens]